MPDKRYCCDHRLCFFFRLYGCDYTQYTELFPHHCNALLSQGSMKTFQLLFSFYALKKISQVHQVWRNYPSSSTLSALTNSSQLARLFKVKVALSPDLNTALWFAEMDLSASVYKQQERLSASAVKREFSRHRGFFDKTCLGFRWRYKWRIMHGNQLFFFFLSGIYQFLQINSSYKDPIFREMLSFQLSIFTVIIQRCSLNPVIDLYPLQMELHILLGTALDLLLHLLHHGLHVNDALLREAANTQIQHEEKNAFWQLTYPANSKLF